MSIRLPFFLVLGYLAVTLTAWSEDQAPWLARSFVPSTNSVHGEVRLLKKGDTACLQTLLYSKYLRRGLHEMAKKERLAWPNGWPCCEVSSNYLADLDAAKTEILGAEPGFGGSDTNQGATEVSRMLIELNYSPTGCWYTVGDLELDGPPEALVVTQTRQLASRPVHPHYASRAMYIMSKQGFDLQGKSLEDLLTEAGWEPVEAPEIPEAQRIVPR